MDRLVRVLDVVPVQYEDIPCSCVSYRYVQKDKEPISKVVVGLKPFHLNKNLTHSDSSLRRLFTECESSVYDKLHSFVNSNTGKISKLFVGSPFYISFERLGLALIKECIDSGKVSAEIRNTSVFKVVLCERHIKQDGVIVQLFYNNGEEYMLLLEKHYSISHLQLVLNGSGSLSTDEKTYNIPLGVYRVIEGFNKLDIQPERVSYGFIHGGTVLKVVYNENSGA